MEAGCGSLPSSKGKDEDQSAFTTSDKTGLGLVTIPREEIDFYRNPHLIQNRGDFDVIELDQIERILPPDAIRRAYEHIPHKDRSVNHWGQRKLLLSEMEFLMLFGKPDCVVVYAGAAPGTHIPFLAELFPDLSFHLYDPAPFKIEPTKKIQIFQQFFTEEICKEFVTTGQLVLFISDIRTADPSIMQEDEVERCINRDMEMQQAWVKSLNPIASMLKFRLPWKDGNTDYLKGDIYLPIWGPQTTTETRLIVTDNTISHTYDNTEYGEQMFHFNTHTRVQYYNHQIELEGVDHCYDCAAEILLLQNYLTLRGKTENIPMEICNMIRGISQRISGSGRTLDSQIKVKTRKNWFHARVYDIENQEVINYEKNQDYTSDRFDEEDENDWQVQDNEQPRKRKLNKKQVKNKKKKV